MKQALALNKPSIFWRSDLKNLNISEKDIIHYYGDQASAATSNFFNNNSFG